MKYADIEWDLATDDSNLAIYEADDISAKVLLDKQLDGESTYQYTVALKTFTGVFVNIATVIVEPADVTKYKAVAHSEIALKKACEVFDEDQVPPPM